MECGSCGRSTSGLLSRCIACGAAVTRPQQSETARSAVLLLNTVAANAPTYVNGEPPPAVAAGPVAAAAVASPLRKVDGLGPLQPGQQFGPRYKILRLLGMGGMGAVYEAHDNELNVSVALKVIKIEAAGDAKATFEIERRFKQELLLARQVTHRNVVRIYDLGEIEGIKYLTMSFVDGADLADVLGDLGRLEVPTALKLARQIAAGLQAAHEAGVIHRDLKPANIMIDGDRAIIMDFGIARSSRSRQTTVALTLGAFAGSRPDVTTIGAMVGTLDYMAPEQARGQRVDQRVDIYAFGLICYDMLLGSRDAITGSLPPMEALLKRMEHAPPPIRALRSDVPAALERVMTTCVQPDREARYQSAEQLVAALDALDAAGNPLPTVWRFTTRLLAAAALTVLALLGSVWFASRPGAVPATPAPVSVLIADFENRTNDQVFEGSLEQALSIGVEGASFITAYQRSAAQRVAAQLKAGNRLNADTARLVAMREAIKVVLAGSIEPSDSGYAIKMDVIDPLEGRVLGSKRVTARDKAGVLDAVSTVAAEIRKVLGDEGSESSRRAAAETISSSSLDAVREYAVAQDLALAGKEDDAIAHYKKATDFDPQFGRAYSGIAVVAGRMGRHDESDAAWKSALSLMDRMTDREKYRTLGTYYGSVTRNYDKSIESYQAALAQYPADATARNNLAVSYVNALNFRGALEEGREVVNIYPKVVLFRTNLALYAMYAGDFESAGTEAQAALSQEPTAFKAYLALAAAAFVRGDMTAVDDAYSKMAATGARGASLAAFGKADAAMHRGDYARAREMLIAGLAEDSASKNVIGMTAKQLALADTYAQLGDRARAAAAVQDALRLNRSESTLVAAAETLLQVGRTVEARALIGELNAKLQAQPRAYGKLLEAQIALREQQYREAIETIQAAQKLADLWLGRYLLGVAYTGAGYDAEAISEFEACVKRRGEATALFIDEMPTFRRLATLPYWLARAQQNLGMTERAMENYKQFLSTRDAASNDRLAVDARHRLSKQ